MVHFHSFFSLFHLKSKTPVSLKGAILSNMKITKLIWIPILALAIGCEKKQETPAVVEEVPSWETPENLSEEPALDETEEEEEEGEAPTFTTPEEMEPETETYSADQELFTDAGGFVVQVNVFKSERRAENLVSSLAERGFPAYVATVEDPTPELPGTYHRVRIGNFRSIADAKTFGENTLLPMGYDYWVDNKSHDAVGYAGLPGYEGTTDYGTDTYETGYESDYTTTEEETGYESTYEPDAYDSYENTETEETTGGGFGTETTGGGFEDETTGTETGETGTATEDPWSTPAEETGETGGFESEPAPTDAPAEEEPSTSDWDDWGTEGTDDEW